MKLFLSTLALGASMTVAGFATAEDQSRNHHSVMIIEPWSRVTAPSAQVGGGYLTIINQSDHDDVLLSVSAQHAARAEVHSMTLQDDVMVMRPIDGGLPIPAGERVMLAPGGLHLMFMQLNKPHVVGEPFEATLNFAYAGEKVVSFDVLSMKESMARATMNDGEGHGDHHGSDHQ